MALVFQLKGSSSGISTSGSETHRGEGTGWGWSPASPAPQRAPTGIPTGPRPTSLGLAWGQAVSLAGSCPQASPENALHWFFYCLRKHYAQIPLPDPLACRGRFSSREEGELLSKVPPRTTGESWNFLSPSLPLCPVQSPSSLFPSRELLVSWEDLLFGGDNAHDVQVLLLLLCYYYNRNDWKLCQIQS